MSQADGSLLGARHRAARAHGEGARTGHRGRAHCGLAPCGSHQAAGRARLEGGRAVHDGDELAQIRRRFSHTEGEGERCVEKSSGSVRSRRKTRSSPGRTPMRRSPASACWRRCRRPHERPAGHIAHGRAGRRRAAPPTRLRVESMPSSTWATFLDSGARWMYRHPRAAPLESTSGERRRARNSRLRSPAGRWLPCCRGGCRRRTSTTGVTMAPCW